VTSGVQSPLVYVIYESGIVLVTKLNDNHDLMNYMYRLVSILVFLFFSQILVSQLAPVIPAGSVGNSLANSEIICPTGSDVESFGFSQDGTSPFTGPPSTFFGEGTAMNMTNTLSLEWEYEESGGGSIISTGGSSIRTNTAQNGTGTVTISFDQAMTNPIISFDGLQDNSTIAFFDCSGTALAPVLIATSGTSHTLVGNLLTSTAGGTSASADLQFPGAVSCFYYEITAGSGIGTLGEGVTLQIRTCVPETPLPECATCGPNTSFEYLRLANASGSGTGSTADVMLNGILYGDAEVLFSDLDINEDLSGATFGAFDNDGGTFLLQVNLCAPLPIDQLDILGLETESQVWVGTGLSGTGSAGIPTGLTLTQCGGSPNLTVSGNMVENTITSTCRNQANGNFTVSAASVSTLYFRYRNPTATSMGCTFDKATFRIGSCVPDMPDVIPACPLTEVTITADPDGFAAAVAGGGTGNAFTSIVTRDANGNYFNQTCSQLENEVTNMTPTAQLALSPCAEVVDENDCSFCTPVPPCTTCAATDTYTFLQLTNAMGSGTGATADITLNGVKYGDATVVSSNLSINTDLSGTNFGAFANGRTMEETMVLQLDFCTPTAINQLDIIGLETESQVWVGTSLGAGMITSGPALMQCDGDAVMTETGNMVTNTAGSCNNQGDGSYNGIGTVSTLFFRYTNPLGGCSFDKTTYRLGVCVPAPAMAIPECPLVLFDVAGDMLVKDNNGRYFDFGGACPSALPTMSMAETVISPCVTPTEVMDCPVCIMPGLAKAVSSVTTAASGVPGNVDVTFRFTLSNAGGANMENLVLNDNIAALGGFVSVLSPPVVTMTSAGGTAPIPNAGYAGTGNLLNGSSGSLVNGQQIIVEVRTEFDPTGTGSPELNSAEGGGTPPGGGTLFTDLSDNGLTPNTHDTAADTDAPTPLEFPKINLAKEITNVRPAGTPNNFLVDFVLRVKNTGNVTLNNVSIEDNILAQLGPTAFVAMVTPPVQDPGFNGSSDIDIPIGTLTRNQIVTVTFVIEVFAPVAGSNQAKASGTGIGALGASAMVMDLSDAGPDPEAVNTADPSVAALPVGNNEDNPTLFGPGATLEASGMSSSVAGADDVNVTLDANCTVTILAGFGATGGNGAILGTEVYVDGVYRPGAILTDADLGRDIQYRTFDLSTGTWIWGNINLENKQIPDPLNAEYNVMCLEPILTLIDLEDLADDLLGECTAPVSDITESSTITGDACDGFTTVRTIRGVVDLDGRKIPVTLSTETINEMPLDVRCARWSCRL